MKTTQSVFSSGPHCSLAMGRKRYRRYPFQSWSFLERTNGGVICNLFVTNKRSIRIFPSVKFARTPTGGPSCSLDEANLRYVINHKDPQKGVHKGVARRGRSVVRVREGHSAGSRR
jgi:hypothetical protein